MQLLWCDIGVKKRTCAGFDRMESRREPHCLPQSLLLQKRVFTGSHTRNTALRISRYCYIVNIASHLPPLIPPGCVFIHHAVMSNLQEWIGLAGFRPHREPDSSLFFSDVSLFSRGFNLFTLTPGKQQINVTVSTASETRVTSEAMSASSDGARALAAVHTAEYITHVREELRGDLLLITSTGFKSSWRAKVPRILRIEDVM